MPLVAAQCTNCGGTLQVDNSQDAAICKFCSTPFIVEKAVQNYQIHNSYNIQNANIIMNDDKSFEKRLASAEEYLYYLKDYAAAYKVYDEIEDIAPGNFKVWYGKICSRTMDFNVKSTVEMLINGTIVYSEFERDIDSAYKTVTMDEKATFHDKISGFLNGCVNEFQVRTLDLNRVAWDLNSDINQRMENINILQKNADTIERKIIGLNRKFDKQYNRNIKLKSFMPVGICIGVLMSLAIIVSNPWFNMTGILTSFVCVPIIVFIIFVARIVIRGLQNTNEKKIMHARATRSQNYYDISEHNRKIQENRNYMMELEKDLSVCNNYINTLSNILAKYNMNCL